MSIILIVDRVFTKLKKMYNKKIIKKMWALDHNDFFIVGNITVINRNVKIGHNVTIYPECMFFGDGLIEIGDNVDIGNGTIIYASQNGGGVKIADNSMIAAQCYIIDTDHGICAGELIRTQKNTTAPIFIGEDVWIAAGCKILKGSYIEDGAVIGAMSLVKGRIKANTINVGIPAKRINERK